MNGINALSTIKKIKLVVAASPDEFAVEAALLGDFIREMNDCYLERGIYFSLLKNGDSAASTDCDLAFFLFGKYADQAVTDALDAARESYKSGGKPRVITYFKADAKPPADVELLCLDASLFANTYNHIDTVKLGILMQINRLGLDGVDIRLDNGKAWQGGDALLSLDNVEIVSGYEDLQKLKTERAELEARYFAAKAKHAENPDDADAYNAFFEAAGKRNKAMQDIRDIETQIYHMLEGMYEQTARGRLSKRQVEGYRLMERGMFREAKTLLDFDGILGESRRRDEQIRLHAQDAQVNVNELMQLKDVNATLGDWEAVDACYKEAVRIEEEYGLERSTAFVYAEFLFDQTRYNEAATTAEKLLHHFQSPDSGVDDVDKGLLHRLLGRIYSGTQRFAEAEESLEKAIAIFKAAAERDPDTYEPHMARCVSDLGSVYFYNNRFDDAVEKQSAAIKTLEKLAVQNPGEYEPEYANSMFRLGSAYAALNRLTDAAKMLADALEISKKLVAQNLADYEIVELKILLNLGYVYRVMGRYSESEKLHIDAIELSERQVEQNPDAYESYVAHCYNNLGVLYFETKNYANAERSYICALNLRRKMAARDPEAHEQYLTFCMNNLAEIYKLTNRLTESEEMSLNVLEIRRAMVMRNPDVYESDLAVTYDNLGGLYSLMHRFDEAENMCIAACEIWERLVAVNPDSFEPDFADSCFGCGELYKEAGRIVEAAAMFNRALDLYERHKDEIEHVREQIEKTKQTLLDLSKPKPDMSVLTPEERDVALLLTEGLSRREIIRRLNLSAVEVARRINAIREKVSGMTSPDPVIDAVTQEHDLTQREAEILLHLRNGAGNDAIAAALYVTDHTVRHHVRNLFKKLGIEDREDVADWLEAYAGKPAE